MIESWVKGIIMTTIMNNYSSIDEYRIMNEVQDLIKRHCLRTARHKLLVYAQDYFPGNWNEVYLDMLSRYGLKSEIYRRN